VIDKDTTIKLFLVATLLTMIAMGMMIITFITGTYAVLGTCHHHLSHWSELLLPCVFSV